MPHNFGDFQLQHTLPRTRLRYATPRYTTELHTPPRYTTTTTTTTSLTTIKIIMIMKAIGRRVAASRIHNAYDKQQQN